jgi:hypothetical protein
MHQSFARLHQIYPPSIFRIFHGNLGCLKDLPILDFTNHTPHDELPTWASDFAASAQLHYPSLMPISPECRPPWFALGDKPLKYDLSSNLEFLTVRGLSVDTTKSAVELLEFDKDAARSIYDVHMAAFAVMNHQVMGSGSISFMDATWRTHIANTSSKDEFPCAQE